MCKVNRTMDNLRTVKNAPPRSMNFRNVLRSHPVATTQQQQQQQRRMTPQQQERRRIKHVVAKPINTVPSVVPMVPSSPLAPPVAIHDSRHAPPLQYMIPRQSSSSIPGMVVSFSDTSSVDACFMDDEEEEDSMFGNDSESPVVMENTVCHCSNPFSDFHETMQHILRFGLLKDRFSSKNVDFEEPQVSTRARRAMPVPITQNLDEFRRSYNQFRNR